MQPYALSLQGFEFLFVFGCLVSWYLAYLYGRSTKEFRWREYIALITVPVVGSLAFALYFGVQIIYFFLLSCVLGLIFEYLFWLAYHKTLNRRLWTYGRFSIKGRYTSFLSLPMWGVAGVIFFLVSKSSGL